MLDVNKGAKALKLLAPPGAQGDIIGYMEAYMAEMIMLGSQKTTVVSMMYYDEASNTVTVFVWDHFQRYPYIIEQVNGKGRFTGSRSHALQGLV